MNARSYWFSFIIVSWSFIIDITDTPPSALNQLLGNQEKMKRSQRDNLGDVSATNVKNRAIRKQRLCQ